MTKFFQPKIKTPWHLTMEPSWGIWNTCLLYLLRNSRQYRNSVLLCLWFGPKTQKKWSVPFFFFSWFWEITVSEKKRVRHSLGLQKMKNGLLTFYFFWVRGWEELEEIFSIILVPSGFPTRQRVQVCLCRSPIPAEADQAESQSQKNERTCKRLPRSQALITCG